MRQTRSTSTTKRSPLATVIAVLGLVGVVALGVFLVSGAGWSLSALATPTISADGSQNIQPLAPGDGPVDIIWSPASSTVALGATVNVAVVAVAGSQEVDTAGIYVDFDENILSAATPVNGSVFPTMLANAADNAVGTITYIGAAFALSGPQPPIPTGTYTIFTVTFTAEACGISPLTFEFAGDRQTDVLRQGQSQLNQAVNGEITVEGAGCETPTPTATATDTPTNTPTATDEPTNTPTNTPSSTPTDEPPTATNTPSSTPTEDVPTATNTASSTPTEEPPTATNTASSTATTFVTNTYTPTPSATLTDAPPTNTPTPSATLTDAPPTETPTDAPPTATPTDGPSPTASNTPDPSIPTAAPPTGTPVPAEYVACDNISERTNGAIIAAGGGGIAVIRNNSTTVAAVGRTKLQQEVGNAYCRPIAVEDVYVTSPEEIGDPGVVAMPVANAVDIFGLLADGTPANTFIRVMQVCFRATSGELLLFADSAGVPRSYVPLTTYISGEYICGFIGRGGTVVQIDLPN